MKSRFVRLGVLVASVMGLLATSTPAEATWVKNVTFNGVATLSNCDSTGFGYPVIHGVPETKEEVKTGPKGVPQVNTTVLNGNTCNFSFSAPCVKESVGKKNGVDTCLLLATGTVTGFCGLSSGLGTATLINTSNTLQPKPTVVTDFKFSSTGTTLRVTDKDNDDTDWIQGEVAVNPNLAAGGSCVTKTVTSFLVTGDVVIKDCTGTTPVC